MSTLGLSSLFETPQRNAQKIKIQNPKPFQQHYKMLNMHFWFTISVFRIFIIQLK